MIITDGTAKFAVKADNSITNVRVGGGNSLEFSTRDGKVLKVNGLLLEEPYKDYAGKTVGEIKSFLKEVVKKHKQGDITVLVGSFSLGEFVYNFDNDNFVLSPSGINTIVISCIHSELVWAHIIAHSYDKTTYHFYLRQGVLYRPDKIVWQSDLDTRLSSLEQRISALESR